MCRLWPRACTRAQCKLTPGPSPGVTNPGRKPGVHDRPPGVPGLAPGVRETASSQSAREKSHQVAEHLIVLRIVQHLVVHLRVPADPYAALQAIGERARLV